MYTERDLEKAFKAGERRGSYREKIRIHLKQALVKKEDFKVRELDFEEWLGKFKSKKD